MEYLTTIYDQPVYLVLVSTIPICELWRYKGVEPPTLGEGWDGGKLANGLAYRQEKDTLSARLGAIRLGDHALVCLLTLHATRHGLL